jgi:mono/diheme cytochrome c family protein
MIVLRLHHFLLRTVFVGAAALPCSVSFERANAEEPATAKVTYSKDIAPLLWKNCAGCHRPGEVGDFPLLTYQDVSKRADFIADITVSRRMPPWKAEPDFGKFRDDRRMSEHDIELIAQWAKAGAPEGDPKDLPEAPRFSDGWQLGDPDMLLKMAEPFSVPADGADVYRCFVIPIPIEKDRMVSAVEFRAGNHRVVHHAILYLDANGAAREKDAEDSQPGFETFGGPGITPTGGLGAWVPGAMPRFLPDGIVRYVKKGSDLVLQIHYHSSGKPETDQSVVGVYFSKKPVKKIVTGIAILQTDLKIPAGDAHCEIKAQCQALPVDVNVLAVSPHMHNLGREFKVTARRPDSSEELPLIWIKDWDFNWQGPYEFAEPIRLPRGSVIKVQAVYDNSANNPKNPNSPPKEVTWGEQTVDEMCLCGVQVFTDKLADLKLIARMTNNELGAGLEGGIPGQAESAKKKTPAKKEIAKRWTPTDDAAGKSDAEGEWLAKKGARRDSIIPPDGIAIPEESKRLLSQFDLDKDGKLTRKEIAKMPSAMQTYVVRRLVKH